MGSRRKLLTTVVAVVLGPVIVGGCVQMAPAVDYRPDTGDAGTHAPEPAPAGERGTLARGDASWIPPAPRPRAQPPEASPAPRTLATPDAGGTSPQAGGTVPQPGGTSPDADQAPLLREFSPTQFVELFYEVDLPNLAPVTSPPPITGDEAADARIRSIAEGRGYRLQAEATGDLVPVDGRPAQPPAAAAWRELAAAAADDGHTILVTSAYRSISHQRDLFLNRLGNALGADPHERLDEIAAGEVDDEINSVLRTSSIPGYSKHHTGYALDVWDGNLPMVRFGETAAYEWMSADNFANAKRFGFVPSYPHGVDQQGPMPEEWEFVWVGTDPLHH